MRLVVSGGGTGGHIYPAIAMALHFRKRMDAEVLYVGSLKGPEGELASAAGLEFVGFDIHGVIGRGPLEAIRSLRGIRKASVECRELFKRFMPDCILATGGYASAPACFAASRMRIPFIIHEMNLKPGKVTRAMDRRAAVVTVGFEDTVSRLHKKARVLVTGTPVRESIERLASDEGKRKVRKEGLSRFDIAPTRPVLLVFGGSQGAAPINEAVEEILLSDEGSRIEILHFTGKEKGPGPEEELQVPSHAEDTAEEPLPFTDDAAVMSDSQGPPVTPRTNPNYHNFEYCDRMDLAYAVADLAITRAGAGTIAELSAAAIPSVLVPYPHAGAHQEENARGHALSGGAVVVPQEGGSAAAAVREAVSLLQNEELLGSMRRSMQEMMPQGGTERIGALICELCAAGGAPDSSTGADEEIEDV